MLSCALMTSLAMEYADFYDPQASPFYFTHILLVQSFVTFYLSGSYCSPCFQVQPLQAALHSATQVTF